MGADSVVWQSGEAMEGSNVKVKAQKVVVVEANHQKQMDLMQKDMKPVVVATEAEECQRKRKLLKKKRHLW
jgi:hypothetical protein